MMRRVSVEIRCLETFSEYEACAQLQLDVWGFAEIDVVPAGHIVAMDHYGGVCLGAFDGNKMVGFVCGFAGWDQGRSYHHSHMLAVLRDYRGQRLGEKLKWAQREHVLEQGLDVVNWTFDPLQAPNANLNLNRLGSVVRKYKVNLYGVSDSPLHGGIPTDRFEAEWHLESQRVVKALRQEWEEWPGWEELPRANRTSVSDEGLLRCDEVDLEVDVEAFVIEFPKTITELMARNRKLALDWRFQTRKLFREYFGKGYRVEGLHRTGSSAFYRLTREQDAAG